MDKKMPWLKARLREVNHTPASLARHLKIDAPRVYEMIAGRRLMQPNEIGPTARYLEWSVETLLAHLPQEHRIAPAHELGHMRVKASIPVLDAAGETLRYLACAGLADRTDVFCIHQPTSLMQPWRCQGDLVVAERGRPPRENDHVVVWLVGRVAIVMVRQLLPSNNPAKFRLRQHNPEKVSTIDRKTVSAMHRVVTWEDVLTQ